MCRQTHSTEYLIFFKIGISRIGSSQDLKKTTRLYNIVANGKSGFVGLKKALDIIEKLGVNMFLFISMFSEMITKIFINRVVIREVRLTKAHVYS